MSNLFSSIGTYGFWGLSASFDCLQCIESNDNTINILLLNPGDIRHILETVARIQSSHIHQKNQINFYLVESSIELICRHIALLHIAMDHSIPIRQRANLFLEVYGNIKVQNRTNIYIETLGKTLINLIMKQEGLLHNIIDLSLLKYRDRDDVVAVYTSYSTSHPFDIDILWEHRLRGYYTDRYDARDSLADYDYYASIKHTAANIIHIRQYKEWRLRGISYEFQDQEYTHPNRTLVSYTEGVVKGGKDKGMKKEVRY